MIGAMTTPTRAGQANNGLVQNDDQMMTTTTANVPRVGGVEDGFAWTGGSNMKPPVEPEDTMCLRPTTPVRDKMRHHAELKKGIHEDMKSTST